MASPTVELTAFAQSVYLVIKNRYFDDIASEDGQLYLTQVVDWVNMFLDELENTVGPDGQLIDWWFSREVATLGTVTEGASSITIPSTVDHLITDENRYVQIQQDGTPVSNWAVVQPRDIDNSGRHQEDKCAVIGGNLVFSRAFRDTEAGGSIVGDVINKLPRIAYTQADDANNTVTATNIKLLSTVRPQLLLKLGVAKNATLPDIVQGKLSPSYATKFDNLMNGAIARSIASSQAAKAGRENFSGVRGVY